MGKLEIVFLRKPPGNKKTSFGHDGENVWGCPSLLKNKKWGDAAVRGAWPRLFVCKKVPVQSKREKVKMKRIFLTSSRRKKGGCLILDHFSPHLWPIAYSSVGLFLL